MTGKEQTVLRLKNFLGLLLMMRILKKPLTAQYWSVVKEPFIQYATVWFSYELKSVPTTVVDATLHQQHPATVT